jgi:hypothetical protein
LFSHRAICNPPINAVVKGKKEKSPNGQKTIKKTPGPGTIANSGCFYIPGKFVRMRIYPECESETRPSVRFSERGKNMDCRMKDRLRSARRFEIRSEFEHFVGGRNTSRNALALYAGQVLAHS